jgi:FKBP-type peptidyl-prolyl cis-trans isomerase 2
MAVETGKTVKVAYTGVFDDGEVFDSSPEGAPLEFVVGTGQVIPGFDQAVAQMSLGENRKVRIPASDAYGPHNPDLLIKTDPSQFGDGEPPEIGQEFRFPGADGNVMFLRVTSVSADEIILDANHPLAGKDLTFELELVDIL